ncbi:MAG: hypothetical protein AB7O73_11060, partial [Bacteroidia bacterium]
MPGQNFWLQSSGGTEVDEAMDICHNSSGESYVTGYFTNSCLFQNTYLTSSSAGIPDGFIYKTASNGQMLWVVKFGSSGSDRGVQCKIDANQNLIVSGYFYGTVTFGSFTLTSNANSQDVFVAKLDPSGNFLWAVKMGGPLTDTPYGMCIDSNNNILLTGSFKSNAQFGSQNFTSITNPNSNSPSDDVFTTKISGNGNFLWTRTGQAKYEDRGLNVAVDSQNNIYVCGQFSDTIQFNNSHQNQIMNAAFIIKYSSSGNELWFKKAAATSVIAYGIECDANDNLYLCGDFTGNLIFYNQPNISIGGNFQNRIFLTQFTSSGSQNWLISESSKNYISARDLSIDSNNDIYILGEFGCGLTDYQNSVAQGVFNSIGYVDVFISKYNHSNGNRIWERQIGGPSHDKVHGISMIQPDKPLIAGSYFNKFSVPNSNSFGMYPNSIVFPVFAPYQASNYCNDFLYNSFVTAFGIGFSDAIAGTLVDISRNTYDYYSRSGAVCNRPFKGVCIDKTNLISNCPDTINICPGNDIYAVTFTGNEGHIGPYHSFKWGAGDTLINTTPSFSGI